jgi:hypothetical protein
MFRSVTEPFLPLFQQLRGALFAKLCRACKPSPMINEELFKINDLDH